MLLAFVQLVCLAFLASLAVGTFAGVVAAAFLRVLEVLL